MKYICNHLGHTQKIHDQYYRQTSGLIERIDIAKLMLIQDHNLVSRYANKKLEEIQFEGSKDMSVFDFELTWPYRPCELLSFFCLLSA